MRALKLQMQLTIDGYCGSLTGEFDWMIWDWSEDIKTFVSNLTNPVDTIILGRKMTDGFISHWEKATSDPADPEYTFGKKMVDTQKVVFTRTLDKSPWRNTTLAKGKLEDEIFKLKDRDGGDIILYGGAGFVSEMVKYNLIDDYFLFINPVALGNGRGLPVFPVRTALKLAESKAFDCGIVMLHYKKFSY